LGILIKDPDVGEERQEIGDVGEILQLIIERVE